MEVEYRLDWTDFAALQRHYAAHGRERQRVRWLILWLFWSVVAVWCVVLLGKEWLAGTGGLSLLAMVLLVFTVLIPALWLRQYVATRRAWQQLEPLFEKGNWRISLAPDGFYFVRPDFQSFTKWSGVVRIDETPTHVLFYILENQAHIVPARAFASDVEFRAFVGLARKYKEAPPAAADQPPPAPSDAITRTTDFTS